MGIVMEMLVFGTQLLHTAALCQICISDIKGQLADNSKAIGVIGALQNSTYPK